MRSVSGDVEAHQSQDQERERLTTLGGLAALSLDALSSVAYGPEAILVVLVTAGAAALKYSLPVTGAIVVLLAALVISYRQVIEAFPNGGGAYAVSKQHLGRVPSLVALPSLTLPRPIQGGPARPSDKHRKLPPDNVRHAAAPLVAR